MLRCSTTNPLPSRRNDTARDGAAPSLRPLIPISPNHTEITMTQIQPVTTEPTATLPCPDYATWEAEAAKHRAALAPKVAQAKTSLFDCLEDAGLILITVDFDGSGDSGQIEGIFAFMNMAKSRFPKAACRASHSIRVPAPTRQSCSRSAMLSRLWPMICSKKSMAAGRMRRAPTESSASMSPTGRSRSLITNGS
jgi:hypothetical protein